MASLQCQKPSNETCQPKYGENSMGQTVSKVTTWAVDEVRQGPLTSSHTHAQGKSLSCPATPKLSESQTCCDRKTQSHQLDQAVAKAQAQCNSQTTKGLDGRQTAGTGTACQEKTKRRGEHKKKERKGLLQKIKDAVSGHSDSSDSSSSSESDSDNDTCGKRKN